MLTSDLPSGKISVDFGREAGHIFPMAVAFKEWALVCEALGRGDQSVILRKGGVSEGKRGFGFDHPEFHLFPTWYHGQLEKIRIPGAVLPVQDRERVSLSHTVTVEWSGRVPDLEAALRLEPLHVLDQSVIRERFVYDTDSGSLGGIGIHVAFVRVFRIEPSLVLPMDKAFGGCRSWIELPENAPSALVSVLSNEEHERRKALFSGLLGVSW